MPDIITAASARTGFIADRVTRDADAVAEMVRSGGGVS